MTKNNGITEIRQLLDEIKAEGKLIGVLLSDREGNLLCENLDIDFNKKICSSMCASVLESALALAKSSGEHSLKKIIAEIEDQSIIIIECDIRRFLALFINSESRTNHILSKINIFIKKMVLFYEYH